MFRTPLQHNSGRATSLDGNCTCRVGRIQSIFISGQLKVIPLFRYSVIPYSAFYSVPLFLQLTWTPAEFYVYSDALAHL